MNYITFDKSQLINLQYVLNKELIRSNRAGSYASSTLVFCNTRKYHGLLISPQPKLDNDNHLILSNLQETIIQNDKSFNIGITKYPGTYNPKGHKYIEDFIAEPIPTLIYRVGGVLLEKKLLLVETEDRILIQYTLLDAHSPIKMQLRPFLAFRNIHKLSKANMYIDSKYSEVDNGIKMRLYQGYSDLNMQINKKMDYYHRPDWYYNIEYIEEQQRGYDYQEDLFVPGFFEIVLKKGDAVVFSAGLSEIKSKSIKRLFAREENKRIPRNSFENCLKNSAQQFIVNRDNKTEIIAGFPWFGRWGRDTFIALPGLTCAMGDFKTCKKVIDTMLKDLKGPLFPNVGINDDTALNSVDASLWFFYALQHLAKDMPKEDIWKTYKKKIKNILEGYQKGTYYSIHQDTDGLIYAGEQGVALTWMDAVVGGIPVTPRTGKQVEINALWYNAVSFALELAKAAEDKKFVKKWQELPAVIQQAFLNTFWSDEKGYLADYIDERGEKNWDVRPNQVFALSLPYSMLDVNQHKSILEIIKSELLTDKGLRTLSPKNPKYKGIYKGNQSQRDSAYHQGTVWPWLLGHYAEAFLKLYKKSGIYHIETLYNNFEEEMSKHGIGTISEVYDGNPPHNAGGAISQAWSVAEILRTKTLIEKYK